MNPSAASEHLDELDGMLRLAVQQIVAAPMPAGASERMIERAAKWGPPLVRTPAKVRTQLYLAAAATLVLVLLVAAAIALVGGLPKGKPIAVPPRDNKTENVARAEHAPAIPLASQVASSGGANPASGGSEPDKRLGKQPFSGFGGGGFGAGGVAPKRGGALPAGAGQQPDKTDQERMVGNWFIMNDDSLRKGEMWVITEDNILMYAKHGGANANRYLHRLDAGQDPKQIDITVTLVNGPTIGVIKGLYALDGEELRLCLAPLDKDRPAAFPKKPGSGEVLILQRATSGASPPQAKEAQPAAKKDQKQIEEKPAMTKEEQLRVLIDKLLAAHGGEDKLNKLQFTMTVKHSNGETQHYFVQPPKNFRWETTHRDGTSKRIVILFPEGRRWWRKEPNENAKEFIPTGLEPLSVEGWFDYVKFFGPRQVLRLKDPDHKMALLDEETKIGDRAAVGVKVTGPHYNQTMYFDKETHLLLKGTASDILREVAFSDYKKFDGIPIAQKEHDGHFEPEVIDFRAVDKFDAKLFEQP